MAPTPARDAAGNTFKHAVSAVEQRTLDFERAITEAGRGLGTPDMAVEGIVRALERALDLAYEQLKALRILAGD